MTAALNVAILTWALYSTAPVMQPGAAQAQQATPGGGPVALIGCVERLPAAQGAPANAAPTFKLIDVQPGAGTRMSIKVDSQFLLAASKSMASPVDLGKFQNQRVEVTGTIAPLPPATVSAPAQPGAPAGGPLPTFTLTSLRVVSTECK